MKEVTVLYRPVGSKELELIKSSACTAFPPRLSSQPIFYPVMSEEYARQIARDWNAKNNHDHHGYVTRFRVLNAFLQKYDVHIVGGPEHTEYWIPTEDLAELNRSIVGKIEVIAQFSQSDSNE